MPLHRRLPKLKGFSNLPFKTTTRSSTSTGWPSCTPTGGEVTPDDLVAKGAVRPGELVKVLGQGEIDVALPSPRTVLGHRPGEDHRRRRHRYRTVR